MHDAAASDGWAGEGGVVRVARRLCETEIGVREAITKQKIEEDEREKEPRGGESVLPAEKTGVGWWFGRQ